MAWLMAWRTRTSEKASRWWLKPRTTSPIVVPFRIVYWSVPWNWLIDCGAWTFEMTSRSPLLMAEFSAFGSLKYLMVTLSKTVGVPQ